MQPGIIKINPSVSMGYSIVGLCVNVHVTTGSQQLYMVILQHFEDILPGEKLIQQLHRNKAICCREINVPLFVTYCTYA